MMIRTRFNLSPVGFRVGHVPLNVNTIILTDMSLKQRSVSWHTRLEIRHRLSCLSEEEDIHQQRADTRMPSGSLIGCRPSSAL